MPLPLPYATLIFRHYADVILSQLLIRRCYAIAAATRLPPWLSCRGFFHMMPITPLMPLSCRRFFHALLPIRRRRFSMPPPLRRLPPPFITLRYYFRYDTPPPRFDAYAAMFFFDAFSPTAIVAIFLFFADVYFSFHCVAFFMIFSHAAAC